MERSKTATFIGFCIKARKCKSGANAVATLKSARLLIVCRSASVNSREEAVKTAKKLGARLYVTVNDDLSALVHRDNIKVFAVTDSALAKAIEDNAQGELLQLQIGGLGL